MIRTAFVTGAARGIGMAASRSLAEAGWRVYGVDKDKAEDETPFARFTVADLTESSGMTRAVRSMLDNEDQLHVLVNNAGRQIIKPLLKTTIEELDTIMAVNFKVPLLLVQSLYPFLSRAPGAVINVCSVHSMATSRDIGAYAASKAALQSLTRTMALEFGADGVRANALLPGAVDTAMLQDGLDRNHVSSGSLDTKLAEMASRHVLLRLGRPEDMAKAILFLADEKQSGFMTGQSLVLDGGCLCKLSTE